MEPNCLYPDCKTTKKDHRCRGLCNIHYQMAFTLVKRHLTTWEELEKKGKVKPKARITQPSSAQWFLGE